MGTQHTILCAYLIPASVLCQIASKRSPEKASHVFRRLACKAHGMSKRVHADFVGVRLLCSAILLSTHVPKTGHRPYQTSTLKERLQPPNHQNNSPAYDSHERPSIPQLLRSRPLARLIFPTQTYKVKRYPGSSEVSFGEKCRPQVSLHKQL